MDETTAGARPELRATFDRLRANRWRVASTTAEQRVVALERLRAALVEARRDLHDAMAADFRKHRVEVDLTEVDTTLREIDHTVAHLSRWMRPVKAKTPVLLSPARSEIRYEPRGVVLVMAPWNYPVQLLLAPLVAAVAAGNVALVRPSEKVPRTAAVLERIVTRSFSPDEVACVVEAGVEQAGELLTLPFDHVFFTGSTAVGRRVMAAAATHLASVTLELGGKSPAIVDDTADVAAAAERVMWGKLLNGGQTCVAPDYALVHRSVADAFVEAACRAVERMYGRSEEARQASPDLARMVDGAAFARVSRLLDETVAAGASVVMGGRTDAATRYIAPTILTGAGWDTPIMRDEIFGPVLPVLTFASLDEVPARIDALGKPLALYVFSSDEANVESVLANTTSGGAFVNNVVTHLANPHLPFGGVGESGQGSYHGWYGFRTFSHERSVMHQGRVGLGKLLYPPYGRRADRLARLSGRL